ncbi:MAG: hypothetical protein HY885_02885 [Deltaproteobacteria bacterium]|nr:hypothetical protein [Deltaproteobacteria bacterium]
MRKRGLFFVFACLVPAAAHCATPIVGDWNGSGVDSVGLFSGNKFLLDYDDDGVADEVIGFGRSTDLPVAGDFNGDGFADIGVFRGSDRKFFIDYDLDSVADDTVTIGRSSDLPVVGDWDSDGWDDIGVFRPSARRYYMDSNWDGIHDRAVTIGRLGDYSLVGDWDGDGVDSIGIFRPSVARFYLDDDDDGVHDHAQYFGRSTDVPIVGDWDGDGDDDIGVYRPSVDMFYLDDDFDGIAEWSIPGTVEPVTGTWLGGWHSEYGDYGSMTTVLVQTGSGLSGTLSVSNTECGNVWDVPLVGNMDSNGTYSFDASYDCGWDIVTLECTNGVVSADGLSMVGDYSVYASGYYYDSGTFTIER